jgi:hypothetical protein
MIPTRLLGVQVVLGKYIIWWNNDFVYRIITFFDLPFQVILLSLYTFVPNLKWLVLNIYSHNPLCAYPPTGRWFSIKFNVLLHRIVNPINKLTWVLGIFPLRSPLLRESACLSLFLGLLRCFTSAGLRLPGYYTSSCRALPLPGFPIQIFWIHNGYTHLIQT